jgi:4-amino-4-deoxy-L-arabinose transferase-like glycosyltransferase
MHRKEYPVKKILLFLIIIAAIFLRIYNLNYMEFKGDEGFNSFKALKLVKEGAMPLFSSISSTGIHEPPVFMYLLAIPYVFSTNPVVATGFIALLNVLGIVLCYMFVKRYYNEKSALIAAAFYAVNPWQILFSRKIWAQNLLPPFVILFLFLIFNAVHDKKKTHIIYAFIVLGFILQLHLSAAYFSVIITAILIKYWKEIDKRYLAIGIGLFFLTFLPYITHQLSNDFVDVHKALSLSKKDSSFHNEVYTVPLTLMNTKGFSYTLGLDFPAFETGIIRIDAFDYFSGFILILSVLTLFCSIRSQSFFILLVWLIAGALYIAFNKADIQQHYFNSFFPMFFILMGNMVNLATGIGPKFWRYCVYSIVAILLSYQLLFSFHFLNFIKQKQCIIGEYGQPYAYRIKRIEKIISRLDTPTISSKIRHIHAAACRCPKCDFLATKFIIKHLRPDYGGWHDSK